MGVTGYQVTKTEEKPPAIELDQNKWLISWYSLRPNIVYSEKQIYEKYFEQLFRRKHDPENILALNYWMREIMKGWKDNDNCYGLHESLLRLRTITFQDRI
jgi:hypothetical protein